MTDDVDDREAEVVPFTGGTTLDIPCDQVLGAPVGELSTAVVIGWTRSGEVYFSSSTGDRPQMLYLLEVARSAVMED